jgi:hypothetical protein
VALPPVVRPPVSAPATPAAQPSRADRVAAQRAFFEAALAGKAPPAPRSVRAAEAVRAVAAVEASDRLAPPGSIIDIWV